MRLVRSHAAPAVGIGGNSTHHIRTILDVSIDFERGRPIWLLQRLLVFAFQVAPLVSITYMISDLAGLLGLFLLSK